jgi:hypothetical protein
MARDEEGFLGRWSRRKDEARRAGEAAPGPRAESGAQADRAALPPDARPPAGDAAARDSEKREPVDLSKLPSIDSLNAQSDYSEFMREGVPEDLRRQALRKLWASDPVLSAPDLLDIHAFDYNAVPTFPEGIRTLFRAELGMVAPEPQAAAGDQRRDAAGGAEPTPTREPQTPSPAVEKGDDSRAIPAGGEAAEAGAAEPPVAAQRKTT